MHTADVYLKAIGKFKTGSMLSALERQALDVRLQEDASSYYQAALFSFVDGLRSIPRGFFSFATVKLYYSVFYALRARLAIAGHCIFYDVNKGRLISTESNSRVANANTASTHKLVFSRFKHIFPGDLALSQEIAAEGPLEWLVAKREQANYGQGRFIEPVAPDHLRFAATSDVREMLNSYMSDNVYMHDSDHAIVAFPLKVLLELHSRLHILGLQPISSLESEFIGLQLKDLKGPIGSLDSLFR